MEGSFSNMAANPLTSSPPKNNQIGSQNDINFKPYECHLCDKRFTQIRNKNAHIRTIHEKYKPFECFHCGLTSNRKANLMNHIRKMHGSILQNSLIDRSEKSNSKISRLSRLSSVSLPSLERSSDMNTSVTNAARPSILTLNTSIMNILATNNETSQRCMICAQPAKLNLNQFFCDKCNERFASLNTNNAPSKANLTPNVQETNFHSPQTTQQIPHPARMNIGNIKEKTNVQKTNFIPYPQMHGIVSTKKENLVIDKLSGSSANIVQLKENKPKLNTEVPEKCLVCAEPAKFDVNQYICDKCNGRSSIKNKTITSVPALNNGSIAMNTFATKTETSQKCLVCGVCEPAKLNIEYGFQYICDKYNTKFNAKIRTNDESSMAKLTPIVDEKHFLPLQTTRHSAVYQCPQCSTYTYNSNAVANAGRFLKCFNCGYLYFGPTSD